MKRFVMGFTLMELMITIAIAGILMAIAVPSLTRMMATTSLSGVANDFYGDVMSARVEAMKRGRAVVICPTANGTTCTTAWTNRRLTFVDLNADGNLTTTSPADTVLRVSEPVRNGITVTDSGANQSSRLRFRPLGSVIGGANREFTLSGTGLTPRRVCLSFNGQAALTQPGQACPT